MEINCTWEELRKRKLFVATPAYAGQCFAAYAQSLVQLGILCQAQGIGMQLSMLSNESLITRARSYSADLFLRSDCTHMLFIDSDISFDANSVIQMLALQSDDSEYDIICGPYPKKTLALEKLVAAVNKGVADEDPEELTKYIGDFVFNMAPGVTSFKLDEPVEVAEAGTGFMMIRRKTFERYAAAHPELSYKPDHVRTADFDGSREITMFFDCIIDPESRRYLSEDYQFCHTVRKLGMKVWMCPFIHLQHWGTFCYGGSLPHLVSIGENLTADVSKIRPQKTTPVIEKKRPKFKPGV